MQLKNGIALIAVIIFATSCGDSSTKTDTTDTLTTSENRVEPVPVNTDVVVPDTVRTSFKAKYPAVANKTG